MAASTSPRRTGAGRGQVMFSRGMSGSGQRKAADGGGGVGGFGVGGDAVTGGFGVVGAAGSSELQPAASTAAARASPGREEKRNFMPGILPRAPFPPGPARRPLTASGAGRS